MNLRPTPRATRRLIPATGWAAGMFMVAAASAQVQPPGMQDRAGNEYRYPVLTQDVPSVYVPSTPTISPDLNSSLHRKLATTILPYLEFHATELSEAIEQIREESRRLDPDHGSGTFGVFLKMPSASPAATPAGITLTLERIPVLEALRQVAAQAGMRVKVESGTVLVTPLSESDAPLINADFRIPWKALTVLFRQVWTPPGIDDSDGLTGGVLRHDMKARLESLGITFPPGASAIYLPATQKLVVRNTQENVDRIESMVAPLPVAPTHP